MLCTNVTRMARQRSVLRLWTWKLAFVTCFCIVAILADIEADPGENDDGGLVISLEQFAEVVTSGNRLVIDVRDPEAAALERMEAERYVNIPLSDVETSLDLAADDFQWMYDVDKPEEDEYFVFISEDGVKSEEALKQAKSMNYTNAQHVDGGLVRWLKEKPNLVIQVEEEDEIENENTTSTAVKDEL